MFKKSVLAVAFGSLIASAAVSAEVTKVFSFDAAGEQLASDGQLIYVADQKNQQLVVVDTSTLTTVQTVELPGTPEDVAIDEQANRLYVTVNELNEVLSFDSRSYEQMDSLILPQSGNELVVGDRFVYATPYGDMAVVLCALTVVPETM